MHTWNKTLECIRAEKEMRETTSLMYINQRKRKEKEEFLKHLHEQYRAGRKSAHAYMADVRLVQATLSDLREELTKLTARNERARYFIRDHCGENA
jgi:hypothetical protein